MDVIDTVDADTLETGDLILMDGDEIEVLEFGECDDINGVSFRGYNRSTGMVEPYELPYDYRVHILGV